MLWTKVRDENPADASWSGVCYSPELDIWAATGYVDPYNYISTSADKGVTWNDGYPNTSYYDFIAWGNFAGVFVALMAFPSGVATAIRSSNGEDWITGDVTGFDDDDTIGAMCWSEELRLFVAIVIYPHFNNISYTSPDGKTWTPHTSADDNLLSTRWNSVCWSPVVSKFVAVGGNNYTMYSSEGASWTAVDISSLDLNLQAVCWSPTLEKFLAVGYWGGSPAPFRVVTCTSGYDWIAADYGTWPISGDGVAYACCWAGGLNLFVFGGKYNYMLKAMSYTSPNAVTWTDAIVPDPSSNPSSRILFLSSLAGDGAGVVIGVGNGIIVRAAQIKTNIVQMIIEQN